MHHDHPDIAELHALARRLDIDNLRLLALVCREGSYARAARREPLTTSAISKRMSELERCLGCQLLERRSNGVRPTLAGEAVAAAWSDMASTLGRLLAVQRAMKHGGDDGLTLLADEVAARVLVLDRLGWIDAPPNGPGITLTKRPQAELAVAFDSLGAHAVIWHLPGDDAAREAAAARGLLRAWRAVRTYRFGVPAVVAAMHAEHPLRRQPMLGMAALRNSPVMAVGHCAPAPCLRQLGTAPDGGDGHAALVSTLEQLGRAASDVVALVPAYARHFTRRFPHVHFAPLDPADGDVEFGCALRDDPWVTERLRTLERLADTRFEPLPALVPPAPLKDPGAPMTAGR